MGRHTVTGLRSEQLAGPLDLIIPPVPQIDVKPRIDLSVDCLLDDGGRQDVSFPAPRAVLLDVFLGAAIARLHLDGQALDVEGGVLHLRKREPERGFGDTRCRILPIDCSRPARVVSNAMGEWRKRSPFLSRATVIRVEKPNSLVPQNVR
jgi:hypothetical protein